MKMTMIKAKCIEALKKGRVRTNALPMVDTEAIKASKYGINKYSHK